MPVLCIAAGTDWLIGHQWARKVKRLQLSRVQSCHVFCIDTILTANWNSVDNKGLQYKVEGHLWCTWNLETATMPSTYFRVPSHQFETLSWFCCQEFHQNVHSPHDCYYQPQSCIREDGMLVNNATNGCALLFIDNNDNIVTSTSMY